jgi:hypothetical protein
MSIKSRLRQLEGRDGLPCRECKNTSPTIHAVYPGEEEPEPRHCPTCNRSQTVILIVVYEDEREPDYPSSVTSGEKGEGA